jgi:integrase
MPPPKPDRRRLTKAVVAALAPPPAGGQPRIIWDADLVGFGLRVSPKGRRVFFFQARTKTGRPLKISLGRFPDVTVDQARQVARRHRAAVQLGQDPAQALRDAKAAERDRVGEPTLTKAWDDWRAKAHLRKRPSSVRGDLSLWRSRLEPELGRARLSTLTPERLRAWHAAIPAPYAGNRALSLLSAILAHAVREGDLAANPCSQVEPHQESRRQTILELEQLGRLLAHLEQRPDPASRCLRFMAHTGCRRGEVLQCRWQDIALAEGVWTKPASTTKSKRPHTVPLSPAALAVLAEIGPADPTALVFRVAPHALAYRWKAATRAVGIERLRLHDLRHSFASLAIANGVPVGVVSLLLGHADLSITSRYVTSIGEALRQAVDQVAASYRGAGGNNVVPLKREGGGR